MKRAFALMAFAATLSLCEIGYPETLAVLSADEDVLIPDGGGPDKFARTDWQQVKVGEESWIFLKLATGGGGGSISLVSFALTGAHPGEFSLDLPVDLMIGEGETQWLGIIFEPAAAGIRSATLTINYTGPGAQSHSIGLRGTGYETFPLATAELNVFMYAPKPKLKADRQTVLFKDKVRVMNTSVAPLESGTMRVYRSDHPYFDETAEEVLTIPMKKMKAFVPGKTVPRKNYRLKLEMGNDLEEYVFVRVFPSTPVTSDDDWDDNQDSVGYSFQ